MNRFARLSAGVALAAVLVLSNACGNATLTLGPQTHPTAGGPGAAAHPMQSVIADSAPASSADIVLVLFRPPRPARDWYVPPAQIQRVSVASDGSEAVKGIDSGLEQGAPAVSADGSYVAFTSNAANLVAGDTNSNFDVFVRKTCLTSPAGCTSATTRVSLASDGSELQGGGYSPAISGDGRYVAFVSWDDRIDPTHTAHILVRDTCTGVASGCTPTTIVASKANDGALANSFSFDPRISQNGRYVAFASRASNLLAGPVNASGEIYIRDTCLGVSDACTPSTIRVMATTDGSAPNNFGTPVFGMSSDARYVAFSSDASNLVANDTNSQTDIFWRDTCLGATACTPTTQLASVATSGGPLTAMNTVGDPAISWNGRYVGFASTSELLPGGTAVNRDVFVRDTCAGASSCTATTSKVSLASDGAAANDSSAFPALSGDGRYVAFTSGASNLVAGDTNAMTDVFVRDTCAGAQSCVPTTVRVSVDSAGTQANDRSTSPAVTFNGKLVAFESFASNLVANDTNGSPDVFIAPKP